MSVSTAHVWAAGEWGDRLDDSFAGLAAYLLTSLPVLIGILFGIDFVCVLDGTNVRARPDLLMACTRMDGHHYLEIVEHGYSYNRSQRSTVAFFPAYPLLGRALSKMTRWLPEVSALVVTHSALVAAFILLARFARIRWPEASADQRALVLAAFGLWPASLFFRMAYSESLFACGMLAVLCGMARRQPLLVLALLTGLVTAIRPVGVAVTAAFAWHVLTRPSTNPSFRTRVACLLALAPIACWGLLGYIAYQALAFGTPMAFVQTQEHWHLLAERPDWPVKLWSLITLEPLWGVYVPDHACAWSRTGHHSLLFNIMFWNPILYTLAAVFLVYGARKRWLTGSEVVLGIGLLGIPYVTRSYEMAMASHARFAATVVVNYLVVGRLLAKAPSLLMIATFSMCTIFLCAWTALFAVGCLVF